MPIHIKNDDHFIGNSNLISLTFFDWDGSLIATKFVQKSANPNKQTIYIQRAFDDVQIEYSNIFTAKAGYDFGCWIPCKSKTPTSYGKWVDPSGVASMAPDTNQDDGVDGGLGLPTDKVDAADVQGNIVLKAAYVTNDACEVGSENSRKYRISPYDYGRFGTGYSYSITLKIERGNVPRAANPALRVKMTVGGVPVYMLYPLMGSDVEWVEIAPYAGTDNGGVAEIEYTVIDTYTTDDWVDAGQRTTAAAEKLVKSEVVVENVGTANNIPVFKPGGYTFLCMVYGLNDLLQAKEELKISANILRELGIPFTDIVSARTALRNAWDAKNLPGTQNTTDLTYSELYKAVSGLEYAAGGFS